MVEALETLSASNSRTLYLQTLHVRSRKAVVINLLQASDTSHSRRAVTPVRPLFSGVWKAVSQAFRG